MSCNNCFGGCSDITPDKCIRYTGASISELEISNGDNLQSVIGNITNYLLGVLDGSGININIDSGYLCPRISAYLGEATSLDAIVIAITQAICSMVEELETNTQTITDLNTGYTTDCLDGVSESSNIKEVIQASIDKLCALDVSFGELLNDLPLTYAKNEDFDSKVQEYLDSKSIGRLVSEKMIPYVPYPYFANPWANFSGDGTGLGDWVDVYLCNGLNGTPDLRGRVIVGTTNMNGGPFNPTVDPAIVGNPTYALGYEFGINNITLSEAQMPAHVHNNTVTAEQYEHFHYTVSQGTEVALSNTSAIKQNSGTGAGYELFGCSSTADKGKTSSAAPAITVTVTNETKGGGEAHSNIQPVLAMHYIIYKPSV